jgi:hypothetical protein
MYTGDAWIEIPKSRTTSYLGNPAYILYLQEQINKGKISPEDLTLDEQEEVDKLSIGG